MRTTICLYDKNMSYIQTLKIIAKAFIQWPTDKYEMSVAMNHAWEVMYFLLAVLVRVLCTVLLPISAPVFALLVQKERKRITKKIDNMEEW